MPDWINGFTKEGIFFVTPDVKRGVGFAGLLPKYHIICSYADPLIPVLRSQGANIFCLEDEGIDVSTAQNSGKLLEQPLVQNYIRTHAAGIPNIMYFKPSVKLDTLITQYGFKAIGNTSDVNEMFEDKVRLYDLIDKAMPEYLVAGTTGILGKLNCADLIKKIGIPFVVQFGHGWAGKTTYFIKNEKEFSDLSDKFPFTQVKISKFINGFTVLNNCCIYSSQVMIGPPAIQVDGIAGLGGKPGVTCGRQWPAKFIDGTQEETVKKMSQTVGDFMIKSGFKGYFGIDFLCEKNTGRIYLSEVNARMTASCAFYTLMETGSGSIPLLAYHLAEFLGKKLQVYTVNINEIAAAQLIMRKKTIRRQTDIATGVFKRENDKQVFARNDYYPQKLVKGEYIFMARKNNLHEDDESARLESKDEVLESPGKLNKWVEESVLFQ